MEIPTIKEIYIFDYQNGHFYYNFESYLKDIELKEINSLPVLNREQKSKRYNQKINIVTSENKLIIKIPRGYFFNDTKDWQLYQIFAVLEYYKPEISYVYYKPGEKYGEGENTIVERENTLIKKIFIYHNNQNVLISSFINEQLNLISQSQLAEFVKSYFEKRR